MSQLSPRDPQKRRGHGVSNKHVADIIHLTLCWIRENGSKKGSQSKKNDTSAQSVEREQLCETAVLHVAAASPFLEEPLAFHQL